SEKERGGNEFVNGAGSIKHVPQVCAASLASGSIQDLAGLQDLVPTKRVPQGLEGEQINFTTQDLPELADHVGPVVQVPLGVRGEAYQQIHVAVGAEVVADNRPERGQFRGLPLATEIVKPLIRGWNIHAAPPCELEIHVAVGAEVVADNRPERGQFRGLPLATEIVKPLIRGWNIHAAPPCEL